MESEMQDPMDLPLPHVTGAVTSANMTDEIQITFKRLNTDSNLQSAKRNRETD